MRSLIQFCVAAICIGMVGMGLYLSLNRGDPGVVLETAGTPGRLVAETSTATAFFELDDGKMELTMLFSDEDDPQSVFRTRVILAKGQSHSIIVADAEGSSDSQRFVFRREGNTVNMSLRSASAARMFVAGE